MALSLTACSKPSPRWDRADLPGGVELRDVADCAGTWWAAGTGGAGPAAWTSGDGVAWQPVRFEPLPSSYYGPREVITTIACAGDRVAMIGAVPGGAHGNPRVSTWRLDGGRMVENAAPFETYGGDQAVDVGRMAAGPDGFVIAGNRTSGAAAWFSGDARSFELVEMREGTARDAVALPGGGWAMVGGVPHGLDEVAATWVTTDGHRWARAGVPGEVGFNEIQRVVRVGDDLLAAGVRGTSFGLWRWHAGTWTSGETFGGSPEGVRSLTLAGGKPVLAGGGLWIDGRAETSGPEAPVAVAGRGGTLLVAGKGALWRTTL